MLFNSRVFNEDVFAHCLHVRVLCPVPPHFEQSRARLGGGVLMDNWRSGRNDELCLIGLLNGVGLLTDGSGQVLSAEYS